MQVTLTDTTVTRSRAQEASGAAASSPQPKRHHHAGELPRCVNTRANIYAMLAALFRQAPTMDLVAQIVPSVTDSAAIRGDYADAWQQLSAAVHQPAQAWRDETLDDEYHELFLGVVRGELMPYGSWYLSGYLMERPLAKLRSDLDALGFERMPDVKEPEDHIAAICETMAMIIAAPDIGDRAEKTFFERHVQSWMGVFFKDLEAAKQARFYRHVAAFGQRFMTFEKQYFDL